MLLFRPEHVGPIQRGEKTQTRRIWKRPRVKVGSIHQARTRMLDRASTFALLHIKRVWQEYLSDLSEADARAEGYSSRAAYFEAFAHINRIPFEPTTRGDGIPLLVWAVEFEAQPSGGPRAQGGAGDGG